jgi:peptidoglycan/LPS O-acetylase OafA/YrhL
MTTRAVHRYHALDALRATMMLLGLVLHSAVSYQVEPLHVVWPYKDPNTSTLFDLVFVIHLFRMPVFFVVAGFFAAMLMQRDGPARFLRNRAMRVLVPLALFWPIVFPAVSAGFVYANGHASGRVDMSPITSGAFLRTANLTHLWFLWDLMILYAAAAAIAPIASRIPERVSRRIDSAFAAIATTVTGALAMSLLTAVTLLPMRTAGLDTSISLLPPVRVLVAYSVFFTFGWLLYRRRDIIEPMAARWKLPMGLGVLACAGYLAITVGKVFSNPTVARMAGSMTAGVAIWMLIFGLVGAFVSRLSHPRPIVRYLADASYWMYIVHLPLAIGIPGLMAAWGAPAILKFAITLSATCAATIVSYHYLVRATAIGALLNGRRYPRALPEPEPVRARESRPPSLA